MSARQPRLNAPAARGMTLVELLVAIVLGSLVMLAVITLYVNTNRSYVQDERYSIMQENGRYALKVLTGDLTMADFWGKMTAIDAATAPAFGTTGACAAATDLDLFDGSRAILYNSYHGGTSEQFTASDCTIINSNRVANTDILVIKRVESVPTAQQFIDFADTDGDGDTTEQITEGAAALVSGVVYLRTNGVSGGLESGLSPATPPALGESVWRYVPRVYFIRDYYRTVGDGIPALCRLDLVGTGMGRPTSPPNGTVDTDAQCIAEGIEDMRVEFGIDTDNDGVANQYTSTPTVAQMEQAVTARVYLVARSSEPVPFYVNDKSYQVGAGVDATSPTGGWPANDAFYRRVYTTTAKVRNSVSLNLLNY